MTIHLPTTPPPAPWLLSDLDNYGGGDDPDFWNQKITDAEGFGLGVAIGDTAEQAQAIARLMAAAPDMAPCSYGGPGARWRHG